MLNAFIFKILFWANPSASKIYIQKEQSRAEGTGCALLARWPKQPPTGLAASIPFAIQLIPQSLVTTDLYAVARSLPSSYGAVGIEVVAPPNSRKNFIFN